MPVETEAAELSDNQAMHKGLRELVNHQHDVWVAGTIPRRGKKTFY